MSDTLIPVASFLVGEIASNTVPTAGVAAGGQRWQITWINRAGERLQMTSEFGVDAWSAPRSWRAGDIVEDVVQSERLPESVLAWSGPANTKIALRSGRRLTGIPAKFPGAGLIVSRQAGDGWTDVAFADDSPDAHVLAAAVCVLTDEVVAAYVISDGAGGAVCRGLRFSLSTQPSSAVGWRHLPDYPLQPGVAAPIAGVHGGVLMSAGGANFPDQPPWENGVKRFYDDLFVLPDGASSWRSLGRLPQPRAYSAVVSVDEGVLVVGGENATGLFGDAFFLRWNGSDVISVPAPSLPIALTSATAVILDRTVYLAGGYEIRGTRVSTSSFFRLDLDQLADGWQKLPAWPGPSRALCVIAALNQEIYVMSGLEMSTAEDGQQRLNYLTDAYRYRLSGEWEKLPDLPWSTVAAPSPAPVSTRPDRVFICGGVDGRQVGKVPRDRRVPEDIVYFDVHRYQWCLWPERWPESVVCSSPIFHQGEWIFVSGEIMAGKRTVAVRAWQLGA
ncbi:MAG: hypothetical protein ABIZ04_27235 [Opitutus sp.]